MPIPSTRAAPSCGRCRWLFVSSAATYVRRLILLGNGAIACRGEFRLSFLCQEKLYIALERFGVKGSKTCSVSS